MSVPVDNMSPAHSERPVRPSNRSAPCTDDSGRGCFLAPLEDVAAECVVEIEGEDDVEPLNKASNPRLPSAAEVEEHNRTYIPYRS